MLKYYYNLRLFQNLSLIFIFLSSCAEVNNSRSNSQSDPDHETYHQKKGNLGIIGDSLSSGTFVEYRRGEIRRLESDLRRYFESLPLTEKEKIIRELRASNFESVDKTPLQNSFLAAQNPTGIAARVASFDSNFSVLKINSAAIPGSKMINGLDQAQTLLNTISQYHYIFIMLGGNDVCSNTSIEEFKSNLERTLEYVLSQSDSKILLAYIPPVHLLASILPGFENAIIKNKPFFEFIISYDQIRTQLCSNINSGYQNLEQKVNIFNQIIKETITFFNSSRIIPIPGTATLGITESSHCQIQDLLAVDDFHLNILGQEMIANAVENALSETKTICHL